MSSVAVLGLGSRLGSNIDPLVAGCRNNFVGFFFTAYRAYLVSSVTILCACRILARNIYHSVSGCRVYCNRSSNRAIFALNISRMTICSTCCCNCRNYICSIKIMILNMFSNKPSANCALQIFGAISSFGKDVSLGCNCILTDGAFVGVTARVTLNL